MSKAELLSKLDEKTLRDIAKSEELSVPKNYGKRDLVKYLNGMLTLQKIKEYTAEVYEKETKRTIIHETISEKGIKITKKETTKIQFDKLQVVSEILDSREKIDLAVLDEMANNLHEPIPSGKELNLYGKMSENMLNHVLRVFIKKESDGKGRFLEYRTANFMKRRFKGINRIKIRYKPPYDTGDIDVVGFNSKNMPIVMAECKDTRLKTDYLDKWVGNTKKLFQAFNGALEESYFVTTDKLTDECLKHLESNRDINSKRGQLKVINGVSGIIKQNLNDSKGIFESGKVFLSIYEVRQNQFTKVFPKK